LKLVNYFMCFFLSYEIEVNPNRILKVRDTPMCSCLLVFSWF